MEAFRKVLASSKNIIAVAGAGLSAASGIPTFRGAGGMWRKYDAMSLATPEAFYQDPSRVWQFYHYRREVARTAQPNAAHLALAALSMADVRDKIAPGSTFTLITQNVDGLSPRALATVNPSQDPTVNNPSIIEMHGRLFDLLCTSCGHMELNFDSPVCPALAGTEKLVAAGEQELEPNISHSDLPRCSKCKALARPGVVWFGEALYEHDKIEKIVDAADLCLVIGTSSTVFPAAQYAEDVRGNGGQVAVFNMEKTNGNGAAQFVFLGPCEELLPKALGLAA
ncbi:DHS-like NAD/FAD-binding domain-containing protein [Athelia psychrophila]|uniref:NAD-dependent protein deacylase n=1 Tax=Athelia psychrophila TaxID=1759441 RepID=A0A166N650_9AGAM|nr:DHS-like NAD/FAD-binding domain-containing protein [Fibularhizoctonia sp. CBS 109695]